jgi:hypothetical protein
MGIQETGFVDKIFCEIQEQCVCHKYLSNQAVKHNHLLTIIFCQLGQERIASIYFNDFVTS